MIDLLMAHFTAQFHGNRTVAPFSLAFIKLLFNGQIIFMVFWCFVSRLEPSIITALGYLRDIA
jgi:hypothetical protein